MSLPSEHDLLSFHAFLGEQIAQGAINLTPEEAIDAWRDEHPRESDFDETVDALREALADFDAGDRGIALDEFDAEFRRKHGITGDM